MANNRKRRIVRKLYESVPGVPAAVLNHIYYKASDMIGTCNLVDADYDDLVQEMLLAVLDAQKKCRTGKNVTTGTSYLNRAADCKAHDIYRSRIARDMDKKFLSIGQNEEAMKCGMSFFEPPAVNDFEDAMLWEDIRITVSGMPEHLQKIFDLLEEGRSLRKISRILRISYSKIRKRYFPEIRRQFQAKS